MVGVYQLHLNKCIRLPNLIATQFQCVRPWITVFVKNADGMYNVKTQIVPCAQAPMFTYAKSDN